MLEARNILLYGIIFFSLLLVDYSLGNGLLHVVKGMTCRIICFVRKSIREEARNQTIPNEKPTNIPVLISEVLFLAVIMALLNRYSLLKTRDRIDDLFQQSRQGLQHTNDFLEKWRKRRVHTEYSYLDEEPQPITPLKLEVPILHMAIIDTRGTNRSQPERGDAGDSINYTDSTLLSVTSLLDDDMESIWNQPNEDHFTDDRSVDIRNRFLWNVLEEDIDDLQIR